ncbi:MAG: TonB-dependent receptor plug domain-containing protein [Opitutaceae bacterium]|nr:TonB-dependent receptor plug domain-containing protein [Opitutaceae bacterium]
MKTKIPRGIASAFALAHGLTLTTALFAQVAPTAPLATNREDETVILETFTVNTDKDNGYIAVDSLAGGRTNTPIKLTPASISSLTRTFIDDLGIQDVRSALQWATNVTPTDPLAGRGFGGQAFHGWSFNFRSAGAGEQGGPGPTRNYFSFYQNGDSYNVERVEFLRGPNSILFGLGTVGGTLSTYTKIPRLDKKFAATTLSTDNNGTIRGEIDYNTYAGDSFALRVNALYDRNRGWRNNDKHDKEALDVAMLYKLSPKTTVRVELEAARIEKTLISTNIGDKYSGWDGVTASNTWGAAPTGGNARTTLIGNAGAWGDWLSKLWIYAPSLSGAKQLQAWHDGYASTNSVADSGQALPEQPYAGWFPSQAKLPWETTYSSFAKIPVRASKEWTYGSGVSKVNYENITIWLDQKVNDNIDISLSAYRYKDDDTARDYEGTGGAAVDINKQLPDGSSNPNFGKRFADFFLSKQVQTRSSDELNALVNYHFDSSLFGRKWSQLIQASASRKEKITTARQYLAQVGNGTSITNPADWVQNMVFGRLYLDQPNLKMEIPEVVNGRNISYMQKADGYWFDHDDEFKLTEYAVMSHSRLFDDSLSILAGARKDEYTERMVKQRAGPALTDQILNEDKSVNTFSLGGVYWFNALGVFANYSKNMQPPNAGSQPMLNGERPDPSKGKGLEYGLRLSTGDGKYYATVTRYDTQAEGFLVENPVDIRGIWQAYNVSKGQSGDSGKGTIAFTDTTSLDVTGYEFEITANPTRNIRLQANYGKPSTKIVDYYPDSRAYFAANEAAWTAAIATADTTQHGTDLRSKITAVKDALAQALPGARQPGSVDYTASVFGAYTFDHDDLKGLSLGLGASLTGQKYFSTANKFENFGQSVSNVYGVIAYETKLGKTAVRLALNVDNVLDEGDPIISGYHWGWEDTTGHRLADSYYYQTPRTYRLSARFTF